MTSKGKKQISVDLSPEDKQKLDVWCATNNIKKRSQIKVVD